MTKRKNETELAIADLIGNYLKEEKQNIVGFYMVPYTVAKHRKIELVVVTEKPSESLCPQPDQRVDRYVVVSSIHSLEEYKKEENSIVIDSYQLGNKKLLKDFRNGIILYDPKQILLKRQESLLTNSELVEHYNTFPVPVDFQNAVTSKVNHELERTEKRKNKRKKLS